MEIKFTKIDHKFHRFCIVREDGSTEEAILETSVFFLHDVCHYAVEKYLDYKNGFWGMLAQGFKLDELKGKTLTYTADLQFIEKIVGPVQAVVSGNLPKTQFEQAIAYLNYPVDANALITAVVKEIQDIERRYKALSFGQSISLKF